MIQSILHYLIKLPELKTLAVRIEKFSTMILIKQ